MKKILLIAALFSFTLTAQVLEWSPYFATQNDSITIIYNADQGNAALVGVVPVYAHTGVLLEESEGYWDWHYVKTDWCVNISAVTLQYLGGNRSSISFNIRDYYGFPDSANVRALAFVFRNSGCDKVGRNADGSDIILPLYEPGLNVKVIQPAADPYFAGIGETVPVKAVSSKEAQYLTLRINGTLIDSTTANEIIYTDTADTYGDIIIIAEAGDSTGAVKADTTYYSVRPPVTIQDLPAGVEDGINYNSTTSVTLVLYAPGKEFVYATGDFNSWRTDSTGYMKMTQDSTRFWVTLDNLTPGQIYRYQYLVDNEIRITDPYSELILDPWNDKFIDETRFPGMPVYPFEETSDLVATFQTDQQPYIWQADSYTRPPKEKLIIYEMLIRDFTDEQTFQSVIDTLGYLKRLGVNAIEIMPFNEFEGNLSWGYNPSHYFAPDKFYGSEEVLKKLIDTCHSMDIAVIMDMVLNHSFGQSPMVRLYWDSQNNQPAADNPWFNQVARHPYNVGYDFNHESEATKYFVDRVNEFWLQEYKIDGYRFDLSKGFTQTFSGDDVGLWGSYDASRIALLKRMADHIRSIDSSAYIILEHFGDYNEERELANYGMMIWGNMNHNYTEAAMGYGSSFSNTSYKAHGFNNPNLVSYMESHDEERMMYKVKQWANSDSTGDYNIKELYRGIERAKLCAAFFFTFPGPKMIWQFGELGYDYSINYPCGTDACRLDEKPTGWSYYDDTLRVKLYKVYSELIKLKQQHKVFSTSDFYSATSSGIKFIQLNDDSMDVFVIGNFGLYPSNVDAAFQHTGTWYEYFREDTVEVSGSTKQLHLKPGEFRLYTTVKLAPPEDNILKADDTQTVTDYSLGNNYPNPFNPATTINYQLPEAGRVSLKVYDMLGREIEVLVDGYQEAGRRSVTFDASRYASGIYIYVLRAGRFSSAKKMILMK